VAETVDGGIRMTSTHLVCRRRGMRVFVPAAAVLAVRELPLLPPPPSAPEWLRGLALTEDTAVLVVRIEEPDQAVDEPTTERVVLLLPRTDGDGTRFGLVVDEVIGLETSTLAAAVDPAAWRSLLHGSETSVRVDARALQEAFSATNAAAVHA
jgi:chemotaxis signal transduction protein